MTAQAWFEPEKKLDLAVNMRRPGPVFLDHDLRFVQHGNTRLYERPAAFVMGAPECERCGTTSGVGISNGRWRCGAHLVPSARTRA